MDLHDVSEELLRRRIFEIDVSFRVGMLLNRGEVQGEPLADQLRRPVASGQIRRRDDRDLARR